MRHIRLSLMRRNVPNMILMAMCFREQAAEAGEDLIPLRAFPDFPGKTHRAVSSLILEISLAIFSEAEGGRRDEEETSQLILKYRLPNQYMEPNARCLLRRLPNVTYA